MSTPKPKPKPSFRHEGREAAVKFLFAADLNRPAKGDATTSAAEITAAALEAFWTLHPAKPRTQEFAARLITGCLEHLEEVDAKLQAHTHNYELHRLSAIDRNVMRVAIHEMLHREDIPPVVSINEAIDIARKFGTESSGKFVNGILDQISRELTRPLRTAVEGNQG